MDAVIYDKMQQVFKRENMTNQELCGKFYVQEFNELMDVFSDFIEDNFGCLRDDEAYWQGYLFFLFNLTNNPENLIDVKVTIEHNIKVIKTFLKEYTKNGKHKDKYYYKFADIVSQLKRISSYIDYSIEETKENEDFKMVWFIITELKNADYLFRLIDLHPDYVNIHNQNNESLFFNLIKYYLMNMKVLSNEDILHYKRIFVMLLESDKLRIANDELITILELAEKNLISASIDNKRNINFIINEINRHYEVINQDARITCLDYIGKTSPLTIVKREIDERIDLRDKFIYTIDAVRNENLTHRLLDDAYSYQDNHDGTYTLTMYVPDVDFYVKKDSDTDEYMRSIGETIYKNRETTPMLDYRIATMCSLVHGEERPALAFALKVDGSGKILNIDFYDCIIKVNYNLTRRNADIFMKNNNDSRLFELNAFHEITREMRKSRHEKIGRRTPASIIIDEMNIYADLGTAGYFQNEGIVFPYRNFAGKRTPRNVEHVNLCEEFATANELSEENKEILFSVFDIHNRVFYDTVHHINKAFNNMPTGNVGNPLREYISLETDRLIKDLIINKEHNDAYWEERIERDCIEYTETSARIKALMKS